MGELKKIDYRQLAKEAPEQAPKEPQQEAPAAPSEQMQQPGAGGGSKKPSFFGSLVNKWTLMDRKTKLEGVALIVIIVLIVVVIIYYFKQTRVPRLEIPPDTMIFTGEDMPPDTAPEYEYTVPEDAL